MKPIIDPNDGKQQESTHPWKLFLESLPESTKRKLSAHDIRHIFKYFNGDYYERISGRVRELEQLERAAASWLDSERLYLEQQGEDIPYSAEYAGIVETRIFNIQALKSSIVNLQRPAEPSQ